MFKLESLHFEYKREVLDAEKCDPRDATAQRKDELIIELKGSRSFAYTHLIIKDLRKYHTWTNEQREGLFAAVVNNMQVSWIIGDGDIFEFYSSLFENYKPLTENAKKVWEMLQKHNEPQE